MKYNVLGMAKTGKYSKFSGQKYKKCRGDDIDLNEKASDFLTGMHSCMTKLVEATSMNSFHFGGYSIYM